MENHLKKYRLIKEYPGSPKLGTIIKYSENCGYKGYISLTQEILKLGEFYINVDEVENHPEFWEKVIEKDYEILSYQSKDKIIAPATNFAIEISKPGHWNIHSVKRLSDGEV